MTDNNRNRTENSQQPTTDPHLHEGELDEPEEDGVLDWLDGVVHVDVGPRVPQDGSGPDVEAQLGQLVLNE